MFTGVTAGSAVYAQSDEYYDELEDQLEDFCEMTDEQQRDFFSDNPDLAEYDERLASVCAIDDFDERYDALYEIIDEIIPIERDDVDDEFDEIIEDFEDCVEAGYPVMESYPEQCMTDDGRVFVNDETDETDDRDDDYIEDRLEDFCEMTDEEKRQFFADHPRLAQFSDRLANYCDLSEDEQERAIDRFIYEHRDIIRDNIKDKVHDKIKDKMHMEYDRFCAMSDSELAAATFDREFVDKASKWCDMTPEERKEYKMKYHDAMKDKVKDKMHMEYDRFCAMAESDRAAEVTDVAKLDRISEWCDMTPEERKEYKMKHHDAMKDKVKDKLHDKMMKLSDKSDRLKAMIIAKHDISDERLDEIKMKYREKHGEITDKVKSELKMKFKEHMAKFKAKISDERKSMIHDRLAEMKAFKAELRDKSSDLTDEQKQKLRADFIEKAKDMQLAWINPRVQMTAGVDAAEVECREGFSLVMKASNGVAMCLKADSALKMIDRGIVVPAN